MPDAGEQMMQQRQVKPNTISRPMMLEVKACT